MNYETMPVVTMDDYIMMIGLKTSALIAGSAKLGAVLGGADAKSAEALYRYGYDLGLAFQITDDYLDTFGDPAVFGKNIGGDIVNNKKTWLYVEAARLASGEQKTRFGEIFRMGEDRAAEKIAAAQQLFTELGVKDNAEKAIEHYFHKAMETVEALSLGAQKLSLLEEFATQITYRRK